MNKVKSRNEVNDLLGEIKERIKRSGLLFLNHRPGNAQTLAALEITIAGQRDIIDHLIAEDYCGGPEPDHKYPWKYVALFGKKYKGVELYIKLSVGISDTAVVCLSFHRAMMPMTYHFLNEKNYEKPDYRKGDDDDAEKRQD